MFLGGRIEQRIGPRKTVALGGLLVCGSVFMSSQGKWKMFIPQRVSKLYLIFHIYDESFLCSLQLRHWWGSFLYMGYSSVWVLESPIRHL